MTEILNKPTIFACIPALNEEQTIGFILSQTKKFVSEIFVCDDGSTDNTASKAATLGAYVISHPKNLGKGAALKTLFNAVKPLNPDVVVIIDGDGQHNPNEIPKLVEPILKGEADFVIGSRFLDIKSVNLPLYRRFGLRVLNWLSASGVKDTQSGLRVFSRKALKVVDKAETNGYGVETEQISLAKKYKLRIVEVPVNMYYGGSLITSKKNPVSHGFEVVYTIILLNLKDKYARTFNNSEKVEKSL